MDREVKDKPAHRQKAGHCDAKGGRSRLRGPGGWILWILVSLVVGYGLADALVDSCIFSLRGVDVAVSGRLSPEEIRRLTDVRPGTNLVCLDTARISRRLEEDPRILYATVRKHFPDRLEIQVQERMPAVIVPIRGRLYYMDLEGTLFRKVCPGEPLDFPVLTGLKGGVKRILGIREGWCIQQAVSLVRTLKSRAGLGSVSEIHIDPSRGLILFLEEFPPPVVIGWSDFRPRLARLEEILPVLSGNPERIESVDLRFSGQIVVRERDRGRKRESGEDRSRFRAGSAFSYHPT